MYSSSKNHLLILAILYITLIQWSNAQNCAVPKVVTFSQDDCLRECNGTILATFSTLHIESVLNVTPNIPNLVDVKLNQSSDTLTLEVTSPLCPQGEEDYKTPIDTSWGKNIEIKANLNCTDGRNKLVTFIIPIKDENTQRPSFQNATYNLKVPLCEQGTHNGTCPLNFEYPINVYDDDRDEINAQTEFHAELNGIRFDLIVIPPPKLETLRYSLRSNGEEIKRRQMNVHLYLKESDRFGLGDSSCIDLFAYNSQKSPSGDYLYGKSTVCLTFGDVVVDDPNNPLFSPVFTSHAYYAIVTSLVGADLSAELENIGPTAIRANIPLLRFDNFTIEYEILQPCIFAIGNESATVRYKENVTGTEDFVEICEIEAKLRYFGFLKATVPLVVHFNINGESTAFPPGDCTSTTTSVPTDPTKPGYTDEPIFSTSERPATNSTSGTTTEAYYTSNPATTTSPSYGSSTPEPEPEPTDATSPTAATETIMPTTEVTPIVTSTAGTTTSTPSTVTVTSITETVPTTTPVYDGCCGNCDVIVSNFTCPQIEDLNGRLFPDPFDCSIFHACSDDGMGGTIDHVQPCPANLVFCPKTNTCEEEASCCSDCMECDCEKPDHCLPGGHPDNLCVNGNNYEPDPIYCDVFHQCADDEYGLTKRDCLMGCSPGTIWCNEKHDCLHPYECKCEGKIMRPGPVCNLCGPPLVQYPIFWSIINRWLDGSFKNSTLSN